MNISLPKFNYYSIIEIYGIITMQIYGRGSSYPLKKTKKKQHFYLGVLLFLFPVGTFKILMYKGDCHY